MNADLLCRSFLEQGDERRLLRTVWDLRRKVLQHRLEDLLGKCSNEDRTRTLQRRSDVVFEMRNPYRVFSSDRFEYEGAN